MDLIFVTLLEGGDIARTLFGLLDLLPRLHLFLLEEGNSVGEQLRVPLDTIVCQKHMVSHHVTSISKSWLSTKLFHLFDIEPLQ